MLIIPSWMGKKGLIAMLAITVILVGLLALLGLEFRKRNNRTSDRIYKMLGHASYAKYLEAKIHQRNSELFPLKSRLEAYQFVRDTEPLDFNFLDRVRKVDQAFLEIVAAAPIRRPTSSLETLSSPLNFTGFRSRLISVMNSRDLSGDDVSPLKPISSVIEANENLFGGGSLLEELFRQAVLSESLAQFRELTQRGKAKKLSVESLMEFRDTLNRIESPAEGSKKAIQSEVLAAVDLISSNQLKFFPTGIVGYFFEADKYCFLAHRVELLEELEQVDSLGELTPVTEFPWYAIYSKSLVSDDGFNPALKEGIFLDAVVSFTIDYLSFEIESRNEGSGMLDVPSGYALKSTNPETGAVSLEFRIDKVLVIPLMTPRRNKLCAPYRLN
ncbi:MAG: hypothetical protein GWP39_02220 [Planctomycetia bacterium]|nr:hypothetical protein [Planctomycetia bacterium]